MSSIHGVLDRQRRRECRDGVGGFRSSAEPAASAERDPGDDQRPPPAGRRICGLALRRGLEGVYPAPGGGHIGLGRRCFLRALEPFEEKESASCGDNQKQAEDFTHHRR